MSLLTELCRLMPGDATNMPALTGLEIPVTKLCEDFPALQDWQSGGCRGVYRAWHGHSKKGAAWLPTGGRMQVLLHSAKHPAN